MPLQNRVDPFGEIRAIRSRGALMGNRGGRFHLDDKTLGRRRWASKAWIACRTEFRERSREVMGRGYTELFFLDEATALAAGHRPCFECRRADARAFAAAWGRAEGLDAPPRAGRMDDVLHLQRLDRSMRPGRCKKTFAALEADLPPGAMIALWGAAWLVGPTHLFRWSPQGYDQAVCRSRLRREPVEARVLTPPAIVAALAAGYAPETATALF